MQVTTITDIPFESEPVTLAQAAAFCKVAVPVTGAEGALTPEGELLKMMIITAREWCETYVGQSFGPKTLKAELSYREYANRGALPYGPNIAITGVIDADGNNVTNDLFSGTNYYAEYLKGMSINRDCCLYDDFGQGGGWLGMGGRNEETYTVTYTAGYAAGTLPTGCKMAILKTCLELYNNRENSVVGTIVADLPMDAKALLNPYRSNVLFV